MRGKAEAQRFLEQTLRDVEARHNGALRRQDLPTLGSLVDEYIMRQTAEANTLRILADCLHYATEGRSSTGKAAGRRCGSTALRSPVSGPGASAFPERSAWGITKALKQR